MGIDTNMRVGTGHVARRTNQTDIRVVEQFCCGGVLSGGNVFRQGVV